MHEPGIELAEKLQSLLAAPDARVFFANDGTEANECAIKIGPVARPSARPVRWTARPGLDREQLPRPDHGFAGHHRQPVQAGTVRAVARPGDGSSRSATSTALAAAVDDSVAAVFLEPTQGEGGVVPRTCWIPEGGAEICDQAGALLVIDEIQSGIGRTGHWFASTAAGVRPDILTLAKGLGGGLPIGACIGFGAAAELLTPGSHGSTFGGNPVSCAAALAVLRTIETEGLLASVAGGRGAGRPVCGAGTARWSPRVRGSGLWLGVLLEADVAGAVEPAARERGLLVNAVKPDVIRLAPPLIVEPAEAEAAVETLGAALAAVSRPTEPPGELVVSRHFLRDDDLARPSWWRCWTWPIG